MHIFLARLASFGHLGLISDPQIVLKFHNETHDPKGQEKNLHYSNALQNKIKFNILNYSNNHND